MSFLENTYAGQTSGIEHLPRSKSSASSSSSDHNAAFNVDDKASALSLEEERDLAASSQAAFERISLRKIAYVAMRGERMNSRVLTCHAQR